MNVTENTIHSMRDRAIEALKTSSYRTDTLMIERLRAIPLTLNYRSRTRGGSCKWHRLPYTRHAVNIQVEIGYEFATRAPEQELENCVKHELAHAFHVLMTHGSDHGFVWQAIHRAMGGTAERCHSVPVRKNVVQRIKFVDRKNGKEYVCTLRKWNHYKDIPWITEGMRFIFKEKFVRGGEPQLATA